MVAIRLCNFSDVRSAREYARDLAQAVGIQDPGAVMIVTGELGNNCVEHASQQPAWLWIGCRGRQLTLRFKNYCKRRPVWATDKPFALPEFRTGGYGLQIAREFANHVTCRWVQDHVIVSADFIKATAPCRRSAAKPFNGHSRASRTRGMPVFDQARTPAAVPRLLALETNKQPTSRRHFVEILGLCLLRGTVFPWVGARQLRRR